MRARSIFFMVVFLGAFILSGCFAKRSFRGEVIDPSTPAAEIDLPDHNGNNFRLGEMRGKIVLIFFGFTNCVDECPLSMAHAKLALEALGERAQAVKVVLVSTDPVRDTPQAMKDFLGKFNPSFVGIPGTVDSLKVVWDAYGVVVMDGGETHSSFTYVIDKTGTLRLTFDADMPSEEMARDLEILLAE